MPFFAHNGCKLHYRDQGQGKLLFLLPGNTASSAHMLNEMEYYSQKYRVVSLDFRGVGQSDRLAKWPLDWWEQSAHDSAALAQHLGASHCLAIGTSGGAVIALLLAALYPDLVRAVVADSCTDHWQPQALRSMVQSRPITDPNAVAFWQYGHGNDWQTVVHADSDLLLQLADSGGDFFGGKLAWIRCPVLFTASLRDELLPNISEQVCRQAMQINGSRVFFNDSGSHPLMWSRPEVFRRAVDCFLAEIE